MKRIVWLTDIHLEFLRSKAELTSFCDTLNGGSLDVVLLGGDTSIAPYFEKTMTLLESKIQKPMYFVLGNHDCYHGSIKHVRSIAESITKTSRYLRWLPVEGIVELSPTTGLIGHDSWADGRLGNGSASRVVLNDYLLIDEFIGLSREERFRKLNSLGDEAAEFIRHLLPKALTRFQNIILLTHVPPFKESCWHRGMVSDDEYLPHFSCKSFGDALADTMKHRPESHLTVLCGHTHSKGEATILPNLHVKTGEAEYSYPRVQEVIEIE